MPKIENIIKNKLLWSRNHCHFKKAFFPKNWTCVEINKFSKELTKEIENVGWYKKNRKAPNRGRTEEKA